MQVICKKCNKKPDMIETWMAEDHYSRKIKVTCHGEERIYTRTPKQLFAVYDFYVFDDEIK